MKQRILLVALVALSALAEAARGGTVHIRLVDAAQNAPLEFLQKTVEQPGIGHSMHYRMPGTVAVDGQIWRFARYGRNEVNLQGIPKELQTDVAAMERELGAAPSEDGEVRSDRATEVLAGEGVKALVSGELADGEHVFHPGGLLFRVDRGAVSEAAEPFHKTGPTSLRLACLPVDINYVPLDGSVPTVLVAVMSGSVTVYQERLPSKPALALRLYLPASRESYSVTVGDQARIKVRLDPEGLHLDGRPALPPGFVLDIDRFTLGLASGPESSVSKAESRAMPAGLFVFTDRSRSVFAEGERIQLSVRGFGLDAGADQMALVLLEGEAPLDLGTVPLVRRGGEAWAEVEIDTRSLRPGSYYLRARCGRTESNVLNLRIASIMPDTNMKLFGYHKWTETGSYATNLLQPVARFGLNLLVHAGSGSQGGQVVAANVSPFDDWTRKEGGAAPGGAPPVLPEMSETPLEHDTGAQFLLGHGVEIVPVACPLILYFNVGKAWQNHADDRYQAVQQLAQEWRLYPNFRGVVHTTGDGPTPATLGTVFAAGPGSYDIIHEDRLKRLREAFEYKVGKIQVDDSAARAEFDRINAAMQGAIGFGIGMDAGTRLKGDDAVKMEWVRWLNDLYPDSFRHEREALASVIEHPIVNCSHTWGPGARSGMWEETFWRDLNNPVADIHGDYGIMPFSYVSGVDTLSVASTNRPWIPTDLIPERPVPNGMKLFLEALSRNPAGIGAINPGTALAGGWCDRKEPSEGMFVLMDIARRFGDLFMGLTRMDEIAVLASMRQDALAGQTGVWGAHFLASKAGYQATVMSEEECLRNPAALDRVKAVFLPGMTAPLSTPLRDVLTQFRKKGGVLIADEESKVDLSDVVRVKSREMLFANQVDFRAAYARFEPLIKPFQEAVGPCLRPFFDVATRHVHLVRSVDGDLEYWTLFNDTLLSEKEHPGGGHFIQFLYKGVESDLAARTSGVLYDAFRRSTVAAKNGGQQIAWHADMSLLPGTVYLLAPRAIAALSVTASDVVAAGGLFRLKALAVDDAGKSFSGKLPLEIVLTDPQGRERYRVYRTTLREIQLKIAANDPSGKWTWSAVDQATGLSAAGEFAVQSADISLAAVTLDRLVYDAPAICEALRRRAYDIVLFPDQLALRPTADRLAQSLKEAGVKTRVRILWPTAQRLYPMNWNAYTIEDEEIQSEVLAGEVLGLRVGGKNQFGSQRRDKDSSFYGQYTASAPWVLYRDVILLGRAGVAEGPLLDLIARRCRMLPRNPSENFPPPGKGLVAYAWAPFHYGQDAIVLYGKDEEGLSNAVGSLVELAGAKAPVQTPPVWRQTEEYGQTYAAMGLVPASAGKTVVGRSRSGTSLLPPAYPQRIVEAAAESGRLRLRQVPKTDPLGPVFASVDLHTGEGKYFNSTGTAFRAATLDQFLRGQPDRLASPRMRHVPEGRVVPVGQGISLLDGQNAVRWHFDPFPIPRSLTEARYPRRCHRLLTSPDGKWLLAGFYDLGSGGGYGPRLRLCNDGAVVLVDATSGREVCRYPGCVAASLALADDGSRAWVVDSRNFDGGRTRWNPHGGPVIAAFDAKGRELACFPGAGVERLVASRNGKMALVTYADARRYTSLLAADEGREIRIDYPRSDVGAAVADDGSAAAIAYADGLLRRTDARGTITLEKRMPAPGTPVFTPEGRLVLCADDGAVYVGEDGSKCAWLTNAPVERLELTEEQPPPGLMAASRPFWLSLTGEFKAERSPLRTPPEFAALKGEGSISISLPRLGSLDVALVTFRYRLTDPDQDLKVTFSNGGKEIVYVYPFVAEPRIASVPLRLPQSGTLILKFVAMSGASVDQMELVHLRNDGFVNAAVAGVHVTGANPNTPRVLVPNVHGALGDPRVEQVAYGFPAQGRFKLPADLTEHPKTDVFSYFDGDIYSGTPMYPTVRPGQAPWDDPHEVLATLRSAQVVMEFAKPRTVAGVGIWEHPYDRPVAAFALEHTNDEKLAKAYDRDWTLALAARDNTDYYHLHVLSRPVSARFWRYTVLDTPCAVQRVAEIELYESSVDAISQDLDEQDPRDVLGP